LTEATCGGASTSTALAKSDRSDKRRHKKASDLNQPKRVVSTKGRTKVEHPVEKCDL